MSSSAPEALAVQGEEEHRDAVVAQLSANVQQLLDLCAE